MESHDAEPSFKVTVGMVAIGGSLGATVRYLTGLLVPHTPTGLPVSTLLVNVVGSLIMGAFLGRLSVLGFVPPRLTPFVTTGFLGGLTTFSAFASEIVLLSDGGAPEMAGVYAVATMAAGLLAVKGGWMFARRGFPWGLGE